MSDRRRGGGPRFPVILGPFGPLILSSGIAGRAIRARAGVGHAADGRTANVGPPPLARPKRLQSCDEAERASSRRHVVVAVALRHLRAVRRGQRRVPTVVLLRLETEAERGCGACLAAYDLLRRNGIDVQGRPNARHVEEKETIR